MPGNTYGAYSRFHSYSPRNRAWFYMQGVSPQPVATYGKWKEVGRHVRKGAKAKYVLRPITVRRTDSDPSTGEEAEHTFTRFKAVKAIFGLDDTEGEPLPPIETPTWSLERALGALSIELVPFEEFDGNVAGYSNGRKMAVNDMAPNRLKTACHEIAHIMLGHTAPLAIPKYRSHRGLYEFQAEATAYLTLHELDAMDERTAEISRGYVQGWMHGRKWPSEQAIGRVFAAHDEILRAGLEVATPVAAA